MFCDWLRGIEPKLWVIPPGVDTDHFNPARIGRQAARARFQFREDDYVVGLVSRIRPTRKVKVVVEVNFAEIHALDIIEQRGEKAEIPASADRKILDDNPRRFYGLKLGPKPGPPACPHSFTA